MIRLKNNTREVSKKGFCCVIDPKDKNAFIYAPANATSILGIIAENVPYRSDCSIITSGGALVYVNANVVKGDMIRSRKSTDNIPLGTCKVAKGADAPYVKIGTALQSGRGFINTELSIQYLPSLATSESDEQQTFETVSKNLRNYPYVLAYGVDGISNIVYDLGGALSVTKTLNYTLGVLTSIVLSGDTPSGIELTKTLSYTGVDLTSVTYS